MLNAALIAISTACTVSTHRQDERTSSCYIKPRMEATRFTLSLLPLSPRILIQHDAPWRTCMTVAHTSFC